MALLEVRGLHAGYGDLPALHGISLDVEDGAIVALLGANGAGKTTTFRALAGALRTDGEVWYAGRHLRRRTPDALARLGVAHVPEGRGTLAALTVWDNLALGAYTRGDRRAVDRDLERVAADFPWIGRRRHQAAGTLSGGEQQMLAIARALMMRPRLLLLDEPSQGLAPMIVREVFSLLKTVNARDGTAILVAEQNATIALATASRAYVLETGRVVAEGSSSALIADERVRASYLGA